MGASGCRGVVLAVIVGMSLSALAQTTSQPATDRAIRLKSPKAADVYSEQRVALVIGNGAYGSAPLLNPPNDAEDIAKVLKARKFAVTCILNADKKGMKTAIEQFGHQLSQGGVGLFYYAGHGAQRGGKNYLLPVGVEIRTSQDVEDETVSVNQVLSVMEDAGNRLNIVILDACRNNPYPAASRDGAIGLAAMKAPSGTLIAYATAEGKTAAEGTGRNGVYTKHLLDHMTKPGVKVEEMFKAVRVGVKGDTRDQQIPCDYSSLTGDFYFTPIDFDDGRMALTQAELKRLRQLEKEQCDADEAKARIETEARAEQEKLDKEVAVLRAKLGEGADAKTIKVLAKLHDERERLERERHDLKIKAAEAKQKRETEIATLVAQELANRKVRFVAEYADYTKVVGSKYLNDEQKATAWKAICEEWQVTEPGTQPKELKWDDSSGLVVTGLRNIDNLVKGTLSTSETSVDPGYVFCKIVLDVAGPDALPVMPKNIVLVQDVSAGISEGRLNICRQGLLKALGLVSPNDWFNVVGFSDSIQLAFSTWTNRTPETLKLGEKFIRDMKSAGGADFLGSLQYLLNMPHDPGRPTIAIVVSDGMPTRGVVDSTAIIEAFSRANAGIMSLYAVGTFADANSYLLGMIGYRNRGDAYLKTPDYSDVSAVIERRVRDVSRPVLANLHFVFKSDLYVQGYPVLTENLYLDRSVVVFARIPKSGKTLSLHGIGRSGETKCEMSFNFDLTKVYPADKTIPSSWAAQRIYHLVGVYSRTRNPTVFDDIRRTAKQYDLKIPCEKRIEDDMKSSRDSDGDGLTDREENDIYHTDPFDLDTDKDRVTDGQEVMVYHTNPLEKDTDMDLLTDGDEVLVYNTDPLNRDTDGGGVCDGHEVLEDGTDPKTSHGDDDLVLFEIYINFDYDKAMISPIYNGQLDVIWNMLRRNPKATAKIEGHADRVKTSSRSHNRKLSEARAESVMDYLVAKGTDKSRLGAVGYGFDRPKYPNHPADGNRLNRRIDVYIKGMDKSTLETDQLEFKQSAPQDCSRQ